MYFMFFRNPESYEAKMIFWTEAIESWLSANNQFKFTPNQLSTAFMYNNRKPLCLEEVILDMKENCRKIEDAKGKLF